MGELNSVYPYLGVRYIIDNENETSFVVLFTEPDTGIVVQNNTHLPDIKFGLYGFFDETLFNFLDKENCVRISNDLQNDNG